MNSQTINHPRSLHGRSCDEQHGGFPNAHRYWYRARNRIDGPVLGPIRIIRNYLAVHLAKHIPSLALKRWLYRRLGVQIGRGVTVASGAALDYFFPELIEIGDHAILGMDALVLTHEYTHDLLRTGRVSIGAGSLVGARSMILAGVTIGAGTTVAAMSLVNRGTAPGSYVGGIPARPIGLSRAEARPSGGIQ